MRLACQSNLPYRFKKSLGKKLLPEFRQGLEFSRDFFAYVYQGNSADHIDRSILLCGAYEKPLLFCLAKMINQYHLNDGIFLDVGANVGNHSLFLSMHMKQVHSFEPYSIAFKRLEKNVSINKIENICLHNIGLGHKDEIASIYTPETGNLGTASLNKDFRPGSSADEQIKIVRADTYLEDNNIQNIKLIKVDVEGFEIAVLEGMHESLNRNRPIVVFEMSRQTREKIREQQQMKSLFPKHYSAYCFKQFNKSTGAYSLKPFHFDQENAAEDVIMLPDELVARVAP